MPLLSGAGAPTGVAPLVGVPLKIGVLIGTALMGNLCHEVLLLEEIDVLILEVHPLKILMLM